MKKLKLKNLFKLGILIFGIAFYLTSCQKDDNANTEQVQDTGEKLFTTKRVSSFDIPNVVSFMNPNDISLSRQDGTVTSFGSVHMDDILEVIDTLGNHSYSFTLIPDTPKPNSFFNLIVSTQEGQSNYDMSILEFRMSSGFAEAYRNGTKTASEFTGSILTFPYIPSATSTSRFGRTDDTCVQNIDEVVNCSEVDITGGSPTGGGGGGSTTLGDIEIPDDGSGTSGGYSTGGGGSAHWVCNWRGQSHSDPVDCNNTGAGGTWVITLFPSSNTYRTNTTPYSLTENCCDDTTGGIGVNLLTNAVDYITDCITDLTQEQIIFLNGSLVSFNIKTYLEQNGCSDETSAFAKATIDILSLPIITSTNQIDYETQILRMTNHLKLFGNIEDEIYADYIESLIPEFNSMTINEVREIYNQVKKTCNELTIKYATEIVTPIVTDLVIPVITYAIFEATDGTTINLLQKIPVSMVLRGARLNKMVTKVAQLGVQGNRAHVRIITTSLPVSKAKELFTTLTKNAVSVAPANAEGTIVANMGSSNYITYRTVSGSGFPATIEFNFVELLGTNSFKLKFGL